MNRIFLGLIALPLLGMAPPSGMVVTIGGSPARTCYEATKINDASGTAMAACDWAIGQESLQRNIVAAHVNRGILRMGRNDYGSAEADFSRAVAIDPNQPDAWLNFAIAHYQQGKMASALPMFERAITLRTKAPALAYFWRAMIKEDAGDVKGAYADLKRAAELKPTWRAPARELKRFRVVRNGG